VREGEMRKEEGKGEEARGGGSSSIALRRKRKVGAYVW